jgi:hypothetical protein
MTCLVPNRTCATVHRYLWEKRNALHLDISVSNVMCYPKEVGRHSEVVYVTDGPKFIDRQGHHLKSASSNYLHPISTLSCRPFRAHCLLFDFDNAADLDKSTLQDLTNRSVSVLRFITHLFPPHLLHQGYPAIHCEKHGVYDSANRSCG